MRGRHRGLGPVQVAQSGRHAGTREPRLGGSDAEGVHDQIARRRAAPSVAARTARPRLRPGTESVAKEPRLVAAHIGHEIGATRLGSGRTTLRTASDAPNFDAGPHERLERLLGDVRREDHADVNVSDLRQRRPVELRAVGRTTACRARRIMARLISDSSGLGSVRKSSGVRPRTENSVRVHIRSTNPRDFAVDSGHSGRAPTGEKPRICREVRVNRKTSRTACQAEGRGFESLQPLSRRPAFAGLFRSASQQVRLHRRGPIVDRPRLGTPAGREKATFAGSSSDDRTADLLRGGQTI
jgi:hypothetical protein